MTLAKTATGQQVLKDRSVALSPRQRSAFILVDGKKSLEQLLAATAAAGVTREDIDKLIELGLVEATGPAPVAARPAAAPVEARALSDRSPQDRYQDAYPVATRLTAGLGLRGFRLNLAVEAAGSHADLAALAPRIREAVGDEKFEPLRAALED